jgi:hypothetical protein
LLERRLQDAPGIWAEPLNCNATDVTDRH